MATLTKHFVHGIPVYQLWPNKPIINKWGSGPKEFSAQWEIAAKDEVYNIDALARLYDKEIEPTTVVIKD